MSEHIVLALEGPMMSFGGVAIDNFGVVDDFPGLSMVSGLLGNALGYDRTDAELLDALQDRLILASVIVRSGSRQRDYQTARLFEKDMGWTTSGRPEGRAVSPSFTYDRSYEEETGIRAKTLTHQRYRDYDADAFVLVAIGFDEADGPTLREISDALDKPERPLFLGRKSNLPVRPLQWRTKDGTKTVEADDALSACCVVLSDTETVPAPPPALRARWSSTSGPDRLPGENVELGVPVSGTTILVEGRSKVHDVRRNVAGVHAGARWVIEGSISVGAMMPDGASVGSDSDQPMGLPDYTSNWGDT